MFRIARCTIFFSDLLPKASELFHIIFSQRYTNADLKISLYVRVHIKYYPENFAFLILGVFELYSRKICEIFVYKHTETTEYVKK